MQNIMSLESRSDADYVKLNELEAKYNDLTKRIEAEVRFDAIKKTMESNMDKRNISTGDKNTDEEIRAAFLNYVRTGDVSEIRNINSFTSAEGGVNVPTILYSSIGKAVESANVLRKIGANIVNTTSTTTLPLAVNAPTAVWKDQSTSGSYAETPQGFSSATLNAYKLTALVKISEEVLQDASTDLEATVTANIGTAFGTAEEIAFVSGSGTLQPTGIFRVTTAGGNAVLSQNLGSASGSYVILDNLTDAYYKMSGTKRQEAVWVVSDALASAMRKARSTTNQGLWETSMIAGQPDRFLGRPVFTTSAGPTSWSIGVQGVFLFPKHLTIGDRGAYSLQRLNELYAAEGNVGFKAYKRVDCALHDGNSIVKLVANVA